MKKAFAAAALLLGAALCFPAFAATTSESCQVTGENQNFTLTVNTETHKAVLQGALATPTLGQYHYQLAPMNPQNKTSTVEMDLIIDSPRSGLTSIGKTSITAEFDLDQAARDVLIHINKKWRWGASRISCPVPQHPQHH
jgi:hypothetical protein